MPRNQTQLNYIVALLALSNAFLAVANADQNDDDSSSHDEGMSKLDSGLIIAAVIIGVCAIGIVGAGLEGVRCCCRCAPIDHAAANGEDSTHRGSETPNEWATATPYRDIDSDEDLSGNHYDPETGRRMSYLEWHYSPYNNRDGIGYWCVVS